MTWLGILVVLLAFAYLWHLDIRAEKAKPVKCLCGKRTLSAWAWRRHKVVAGAWGASHSRNECHGPTET